MTIKIQNNYIVTDYTFLDIFKLQCLDVKIYISHLLTLIEIYKLNC